jgi:hypothetical protein
MHMSGMNQKNRDDSSPLITPAAAAELVGVSVQHITKLLRDGTIAGQKFSDRVWMVVRADAIRYAKNRPPVGRPRKRT